MIDNEQFVEWFTTLRLSKGRDMDVEMGIIWYDLLKNYPLGKVENAFKQCIMSLDDFPTVGKVIEMISPIKAQATLAWLDVLKTAEAGESPTGISGDIVDKMGGIDKIGYCENEFERGRLQKQFTEIYESRQDDIRLKQLEHDKPREIESE